MTQWIRDLRAVARNAEADQGRRKRIYVRIPAHPDAWRALGYDVPLWVSDGLVDGLICQPGLTQGPVDQDPDLSGAVALTNGTQCRVLASFQNVLGRQLKQYATPPMIWAAAANAYAQGADGFGIGDAHWTPNGWPWTHDEYQTLRLLGHPEMLATADKLLPRPFRDTGCDQRCGLGTRRSTFSSRRHWLKENRSRCDCG